MQPNTITIAAIDFGSYRIKGALAQKQSNNRFEILCYADELTEGCIHRGVIYNMETVARKVQLIISKLEKLSGTKIVKVFANVGGQSLRTISHVESITFDAPHEITQQDIDKLYEQIDDYTPDRYSVLKVDSPVYYVNSNYTTAPVGVQAMKIDARYQLIVAKEHMLGNLMSVVQNKLGLQLGGPLIPSIALGNTFLTDDQKNLGCVLIDLGAGTTTVSVFKKGLLQGIRVIPLGGINITKDLTALHIIDKEAERIKCFGGSAISEPGDKNTIEVNAADKLSTKLLSRYEVCRYIEARTQEILDNVRNVIDQMISPEQIGGGIIITGGGSELAGILEKLSKTLDTRIELASSLVTPESHNVEYAKNPKLHLLYAIIEYANQDCIERIPSTPTQQLLIPTEEEEGLNSPQPDFPEDDLFTANEAPKAQGELFSSNETPVVKNKPQAPKPDPVVKKQKKLGSRISSIFSNLFPVGDDEV